MTALLLGAALSLAAGVSLGLLGGGGSILTVPILVYVLGVEPHSAIATSLVVVGVTSATGLLPHARAGRLEWRAGLLFGAAGLPGAALGSYLARFIPPALLLMAFAGMVLATAAAMMRPRKVPAAAPERTGERHLFLWLRTGFGVGLLTGLVGAGGGFLAVPALALLGGLALPRAVATSLLVITLNASSGLVSATLAGASVDWALAGGMSAAAVSGSLLGARLGRQLSAEGLRQGFALFILVLGLFILVRELSTLLQVPAGQAAALGGAASLCVLALAGLPLMARRWLRVQSPQPRVQRQGAVDGSTPSP